MAIAFDQGVDHGAYLVQTNVNRRVGNLAVALLCCVFWLASAKANMTLQVLAVVGESWQYLACGRVANVAVMVKACNLHRFVIGDDFGFERWDDFLQRLDAQTSVAFSQVGVGYALCCGFVDAGVVLQPANQCCLVFFFDELHDDVVLLLFAHLQPSGAK